MSIFVRLLGTVDIRHDTTVTEIGPQKRCAMLAALALSANQPVSLSALSEALWGGKAPVSATQNLRSHAYALRGIVGDRLVTQSGGYELRLAADELDVTLFFALADKGALALSAGSLLDAVVAYGEALALSRGSELAGVARTPHLDAAVAGLVERRHAVFEDYCQARLAAGASSDIVPGLRNHLAAQPFRERAWAALMLAQYRSGDMLAALESFGQAQATLREQLGMDPGPELTELHRAILTRDPRLDQPGRRRGIVLPPFGTVHAGRALVVD